MPSDTNDFWLLIPVFSTLLQDLSNLLGGRYSADLGHAEVRKDDLILDARVKGILENFDGVEAWYTKINSVLNIYSWAEKYLLHHG